MSTFEESKQDVVYLAILLSKPQITFFLTEKEKQKIVEILKKYDMNDL